MKLEYVNSGNICEFLINKVLLGYCISIQAESSEGRNWIVNQEIIPHTISSVTNLLSSRNLWVANNAALVLAR